MFSLTLEFISYFAVVFSFLLVTQWLIIALSPKWETLKYVLRFCCLYVLVTLVGFGVWAVIIFIGSNFYNVGFAIRLPERLKNINEQCYSLEEIVKEYSCKAK